MPGSSPFQILFLKLFGVIFPTSPEHHHTSWFSLSFTPLMYPGYLAVFVVWLLDKCATPNRAPFLLRGPPSQVGCDLTPKLMMPETDLLSLLCVPVPLLIVDGEQTLLFLKIAWLCPSWCPVLSTHLLHLFQPGGSALVWSTNVQGSWNKGATRGTVENKNCSWFRSMGQDT